MTAHAARRLILARGDIRLFAALAGISFRRQLTYRGAALAGLATNFFFGLLRAAILLALYAGRKEMAGLTTSDAITYTGLTQALIAYLSLFSWFEVMHTVYSGSVASDLLKPMSYMVYWLAQDVGRAAAALLMRGVTVMACYWLVAAIVMPVRPTQWLALAAALALALLTSFGWRFLINLAAFWTPNAVGFLRFGFALPWVFSGFLMPIAYFPQWFQRVCQLTPFPSMVYTPVAVYLGKANGSALAGLLGAQLAWSIALLIVGQIVFRAGVRRLVVQGG